MSVSDAVSANIETEPQSNSLTPKNLTPSKIPRLRQSPTTSPAASRSLSASEQSQTTEPSATDLNPTQEPEKGDPSLISTNTTDPSTTDVLESIPLFTLSSFDLNLTLSVPMKAVTDTDRELLGNLQTGSLMMTIGYSDSADGTKDTSPENSPNENEDDEIVIEGETEQTDDYDYYDEVFEADIEDQDPSPQADNDPENDESRNTEQPAELDEDQPTVPSQLSYTVCSDDAFDQSIRPHSHHRPSFQIEKEKKKEEEEEEKEEDWSKPPVQEPVRDSRQRGKTPPVIPRLPSPGQRKLPTRPTSQPRIEPQESGKSGFNLRLNQNTVAEQEDKELKRKEREYQRLEREALKKQKEAEKEREREELRKEMEWRRKMNEQDKSTPSRDAKSPQRSHDRGKQSISPQPSPSKPARVPTQVAGSVAVSGNKLIVTIKKKKKKTAGTQPVSKRKIVINHGGVRLDRVRGMKIEAPLMAKDIPALRRRNELIKQGKW
ncbi:hypothetical protein BLNAU_20598 [Blattamonas nauphoetae]|uniref:Uncharacterized protein n=1 Tax=Blattamonas nauphoetae TaxID=2049346 RepID=A0ABQ9X1K4_9EUKA|nr:hypothetical protein BLNAU_20598 [Blattamonas nauphoetae]